MVQRAKELKPFDPNEPNEKRDPRKYECLQWVVNPKIRFIDRFKWNPPVIDDILHKLQVTFRFLTQLNKKMHFRFLIIEQPFRKSCNEESWIAVIQCSLFCLKILWLSLLSKNE